MNTGVLNERDEHDVVRLTSVTFDRATSIALTAQRAWYWPRHEHVSHALLRHHGTLSSSRDNVRDHRARTSDHPFQKHAQVGLRVHRIVIRRVRIGYALGIFLP